MVPSEILVVTAKSEENGVGKQIQVFDGATCVCCCMLTQF
jgi:hypothetical protein